MDNKEQSDLAQIIRERDLLTSDGYLDLEQRSEFITYRHRSTLLRGGEWRGQSYPNLVAGRSAIAGNVVVTGHSDTSTSIRVQLALRLLGASALWAINLPHPISGFSSGLPLGLTNDCDDTPIHRLLGDLGLLEEAFDSEPFPDTFTGRMFANFNIDNARRHRQAVLRQLADSRGFVWADMDVSREGRLAFLRSLRAFDFVLCPRGNGIDTHRLWETLYMGGVPVVLKRDVLPGTLDGLPVLTIDRWADLRSENFREEAWHTMRKAPWCTANLRLSHWQSKILSNIDDARSNTRHV